MTSKISLTEMQQEEICNYLAGVLGRDASNRDSFADQIAENWERHFGTYSCKKDKNAPFKGSADIQTGVIQYSDSAIEAKFNAALDELNLIECRANSERAREAAEIIQNYFNHYWRKKTNVDVVLMNGFQYIVVEGTVVFKIRPVGTVKNKIKKYSKLDKIVGGAKKILYKMTGGYLDLREIEQIDVIGAIWENVPLANIGFENDKDNIQKSYFTYEKIQKNYTELKELEANNGWFNIGKLKDEAAEKQSMEIDIETEVEETKRDYQGFAETSSFDFEMYEIYIKYWFKDKEFENNDWYFIYNKEKNCLHYYSANEFFDRRKPYTTAPLYRIAGKIAGQSLPQRLASLNDELDTLQNQIIDNTTLNNTMNGFYIPIAGFNPDNFTMTPGKFRPVNVKTAADINNILKIIELGNKQLDLSYQQNFILSLLERKALVSDYTLGRESSINKNATATGTAMILGEFQQVINPIIKNFQAAVRDAIYQTAQCLYSYMPSEGIRFYKDNKEMILKREHLEYLEEIDIFVLKNAVSIILEKEKQTAIALFNMFGADESGEINKFELKKYIIETLDPDLKSRLLREPEEIQFLRQLKEREQQLAEYEQALAAEAQELQKERDEVLYTKTNQEIEKFRSKVIAENPDIEEETLAKMVEEFKEKYVESQVAAEESR